MSSASDSGMAKMMCVVAAAIVILAFGAGVVARILGGGESEAAAGDSFMRNALIQRNSPAAGVRTSADDLPVAAVETADAGAEVDTAAAEEAAAAAVAVMGQVPELGLTESVTQAVDVGCAACHISGVANAPKLGDVAAWQPRLDKGMEALTASVVNGLNAMPARGGSTLTDLEIPVAIQYLLSK